LARFINSSVNQSAFAIRMSLNALWFTDAPHFRRFAPACGFEPQKRISSRIKFGTGFC